MSRICLGGLEIGGGSKTLVVAEAGVNHDGDPERAHQMIDAAADAGASIIKFQTFVTEELVTRAAARAVYQRDDGVTPQHEMLKKLELEPAQYAALKDHCELRDIVFISTRYDASSVDTLDRLDVAGFKIASTDTTNLPLLEYLASKGRPIMLSTGMCSLCEVDAAMSTLKSAGATSVVLLHCTSDYPAPIEEANLRAMVAMEAAFSCPVGYSDHTEGQLAASWAVCLGASVIEKHFTLDSTLPGPDHKASLEPKALAELIEMIRQVEAALGDGVKRVMPSELENKALMQKSLVAGKVIDKGELIEANMVVCKRPGTGLRPSFLNQVVGRRAARRIEADEVLGLGAVRWD